MQATKPKMRKNIFRAAAIATCGYRYSRDEANGRCSVWARTAGAWQGEHLVREVQGEYEQRLELE